MTSTVLDVTVLLLCVSASVVALGGAGDAGGEVTVRGPTTDEVADRLATETVTVRYRAPEAATNTRTIHATRAELIALLVADGGKSDTGPDTAEDRDGADGGPFEVQARNAVVDGINERTRIDATIQTAANRAQTTTRATVDRRIVNYRGGRRTAGPIATSGTANAPRPSRPNGLMRDGDSRRSDAGRSQATGDSGTVGVGPKPPRSAEVSTAVVTHPFPDETGRGRLVRIVVRRW